MLEGIQNSIFCKLAPALLLFLKAETALLERETQRVGGRLCWDQPCRWAEGSGRWAALTPPPAHPPGPRAHPYAIRDPRET